MFRVGDKVWSLSYGWGEVVDIEINDHYPIVVQFGNNEATYTEDGKQFSAFNVDLFFSEIPIPPSALERPRWRADKYEKYYFVNYFGLVTDSIENNRFLDKKLYELGNYFKTREDAEESDFYKVFHKEELKWAFTKSY